MQENLPFPGQTADGEILAGCKNFKDSLRMSLLKSGKSAKVVAIQLQERGHKIDEPTLSLALSENPSQKKNFPSEAVDDFIDLTTDIPRRYLALRGGCTLVRIKSEVELANEKLKATLAERDRELEAVTRFFQKAGINAIRG